MRSRDEDSVLEVPTAARPRPRPWRRAVPLALVATVLLVLAWAAWLAYDALRAYPELEAAASSVQAVEQSIRAQDAHNPELARLVAEAQDHSARARDLTHGPHWSLARAVPWVGANVRAVQTLSTAVADLAEQAVPPLVESAGLPAVLTPDGGRIDLAPIVAVQPGLQRAHDSVEHSLAQLRGLDQSDVLLELRGAVADLSAQLETVAGTTKALARTAQLVPPMLGSEGPRTYLLLVQNNAEPRAGGGIVGSVLHLRAENGALEVLEQRPGAALGDLGSPIAALDDAELSLFGPTLATDLRNVTFTPHFPRTGELAQAIWEREVGGTIDGVAAVDVRTLAHLLEATGPVPLPAGPVAEEAGAELTADNAVEVLLNTVYRVYEDDEEQDEFFVATTGTVVERLTAGGANGADLLAALSAATGERGLMLWSAHAQEQALLTGTALAGEVVPSGEAPVFGVYVNDGNVAKTGYYLQAQVELGPEVCRPDGVRLVTARVHLTNAAPQDSAALPERLAGNGSIVPPGFVRANLLLYAPLGGGIEAVRAPDLSDGALAAVHGGLRVVGKTVDLGPGESATVEADVAVGPATPGAVTVRATPLVAMDISPAPRPVTCPSEP